jgi:ABC-type glutathione transport system ATPase component
MSGGMNQRVMIAMAIACNPKLLIADEPTTALDVTIQAQILDLLRSLQKDRGMALVLITHNMGVVSRDGAAHRSDVRRPDHGRTRLRIRSSPAPLHPYTEALMAALPERSDGQRAWPPFPAWCRACMTAPRAACLRPAAAMPRPLPAPNRPALRPERGCRALPLSHGRQHQTAFQQRRQALGGGSMSAAIHTESTHLQADPGGGCQSPRPAPVYPISKGCFRKPDQLQAVRRCEFTVQLARRWPWWANRVAASPRWPAWCR